MPLGCPEAGQVRGAGPGGDHAGHPAGTPSWCCLTQRKGFVQSGALGSAESERGTACVTVATFRAVGGGEISATRPHGDAVARLVVTIRIAGGPHRGGDVPRASRPGRPSDVPDPPAVAGDLSGHPGHPHAGGAIRRSRWPGCGGARGPAGRGGPPCVLPFGLGREPGSGPGAVGLGIVPGHMHHRAVRRLEMGDRSLWLLQVTPATARHHGASGTGGATIPRGGTARRHTRSRSARHRWCIRSP